MDLYVTEKCKVNELTNSSTDDEEISIETKILDCNYINNNCSSSSHHFTTNGSVVQNDEYLTSVLSTNVGDVSMNSFDNNKRVQLKENDLINLPEEIIENDKKIVYETERELSKFARVSTSLDEKEKEKRYKTLMTLLGKSNQYATYISHKLLKEQENINKLEKYENFNLNALQHATNKRKTTSKTSKTVTKIKIESSNIEYDPQLYYKNRMGFIVSHRQPKLLIGGVMRNYQLDGLDWLIALYKNAVNGILADEMGLGKTIQVISLICHLREKNIFGPHLIIGPLSALPNWLFEFTNFAPDVPVVLFHGTLEKRNEIKNKFVKIISSKERNQLPIILTSYEMSLLDKKFLSAIKWCYVIVDEGHRLKNYNSLLSIELRKYKTESRLLLTGTPLQNNLIELWSLLNYLIPEIFDNLPVFENLFDFSDLTDSEKQKQLIEKEKEEQIITKMHQILEPFLLRRMKCDVNISLPHKKEILVYAPLTSEQEILYKNILERSVNAVLGCEDVPDASTESPKLKRKCVMNVNSYNKDLDFNADINYIPKNFVLSKAKTRRRIINNEIEYVYNIKLANPSIMLRKVVNHPYLIKAPVYPGTRQIIIDEKLIQQSGKLLVLDALLPRLKTENHKVLLFSTFTTMIDLIEDYVIMRKHKYVRLDGTTKIENRLESIKQFNYDPETFIFLISTRAGGLGINLTAADTVIIYNSDWNPQMDLQAQDRCHRIGQTKPVIVYQLVTAGTIDERIVNCATNKRRLEKLVMKRGKFNQKANKEQITISELNELLQSTDYKQIIHPNGFVLSDQEIDELLDRSELLNNVEKEKLNPNREKYKIMKDDFRNEVRK